MIQRRPRRLTGFFVTILALTTLTCPLYGELLRGGGGQFICEASYYTQASCKREGTSGIMANGRKLKDEGCYTLASWCWPLGARISVQCDDRKIIAICTDRGPSRRLFKKGRKVDLNLAAAKALGVYPKGLAMVKVEWIGGE